MSSSGSIAVRIGLVIAATFGVYIAGNSVIALWDRDEPRYAQCSRQMLRSGDWVVPRFLDKLRTEKPPLVYWLQATAMSWLGENSFAARLPSAVAMAALLVFLAVILGRSIGPEHALFTTLVLGSSAMVIVSAKMCLTDAVLLLWLTIGQVCLCAIYQGRGSWGVVIALWAAIGLAALTKGPVALGVHAATIVALLLLDVGRRVRSLSAWASAVRWVGGVRPLVGVLILAAVVAPWLVMVHYREPQFLPRVFSIAARHVGTSMEGHKGPPGYYLLTVWGLFLPWSLLLPAALVVAWKHRANSVVRFALAAAVGPWVMVEIVRTKLPHYLLPTYPALAFLVADMVVRNLRGQIDSLRRKDFLVGTGIWAAAMVGLGLAPWLLARRFSPLPWNIMALLSLAAVAYAGLVFWRFLRGRAADAVMAMGMGMLLIIAMTSAWLLPQLGFIRISEQAAALLERAGGATGRAGEAIMIDYKEPSLAFYQGGSIREAGRDRLMDHEPGSWPRWLVMTRQIFDGLPPAKQAVLRRVGTASGLSYADKMRLLDVLVLENLAAASPTSAAPPRPSAIPHRGGAATGPSSRPR